MESENTKAFMVLKSGERVIEKYFDDFTRDSIWYWASAGKTIMTLCIGIAQEQGHLNINDPVSMHLGSGWTSAPDSLESQIKIIHLLTMTSGLDFDVPNEHCTDDTCLFYRSEPDTEWYYYNAPYSLLRDVMEAATGENLNLFVNREMRNKTGITGLYTTLGYNHIYFSTARSMARFGLLMNAGGYWNSTPVLGDSAFLNASVSTSQSLNESYGYLWWLPGKSQFRAPGSTQSFSGSFAPDVPDGVYAGIGLNGQIVAVWPEEDIVVVRMGEASDSLPVPFLLFNEIWKRLDPVIQCKNTGFHLPKSDLSPNNVSIFPNPVNEVLTIKTNEKITQIRIYNARGQVVRIMEQINTSQIEINLPGLKTGLYLIEIDHGALRTRRKFIKSDT